MDWTLFWALIDSLSNLFYQPLLFWGLPFLPAVALEMWRSRGV